MRPIKIIAVFFLLAIALGGCKKEALEVYPEMEGHWVTAAYGPGGTVIVINEGKDSKYDSYEGSEIHEKGKAKVKGDVLKIGKQEFAINHLPYYDSNGDWAMIINRNVVIKSIAPRVIGIDEFTDHANFSLWFAVSWDQVFTHGYFNNNHQSVDLQYKLQSDPNWITITSWYPYVISNLISGSTYEYKLKAHYPWGDSEYSPSRTFTTL